MEFLFLNWKDIKNPEVGGAEVIIFEFARKLVASGHTVTLFCRRFDNCLDEETINGVKIVRRGSRLSVYFQAFLYYQQLKKKPDKVIDMVNTLCWQTPLYVPKEKRILYVNQLAKKVLFYELSLPLNFIAYILERIEYLTYKSTYCLCYSRSTKKDLISFGIPAKNIYTFPLGLDHQRYYPGKKKNKDPLFVFVARLVKMKRADICIYAMCEIIKNYPRAQLAIIGNGPDEQRLHNLVQKLHLEKNVIFINKNNFHINKHKLDIKVEYMQKAWALLLPSVKEGWGMVVTEAAACGTPAIVSNVTGLCDSVINNKTGMILSDNPNDQELAVAMKKIIEDPHMRKRLAKNAITWGKKFNWDTSFYQFRRLVTR